MITRGLRVLPLAEEFAGADLGDQRRTGRLQMIAELMEVSPARSFPRAMGSNAALEALYRFLNNSGFDAADICAPHCGETLKRAKAAKTVIAIHDSTHVEYGARRMDLGPTTGANHFGFIAHAAVLIDEKQGLPLGVGYLETLKRTGKKWRKRNREGQRGQVHSTDKTRESLRWMRGVDAIEGQRSGEFEVVHVTDAEGDFFELLAQLSKNETRFVIRAGQLDRVVLIGSEQKSLRSIADGVAPMARREIELSERKHPRRTNIATLKRHPARRARIAKLAIGTTRITLKKTRYSDAEAAPFELSMVRVWEPKPPRGEPAVEWILLTNERCAAKSDLARVVDIYRRRWVIEEYFKALKSGCALEKRQIESYAALTKVLALFVPIAYRLLLLRGLERLDSEAAANRAFDSIDIKLMANAPANRGSKPPKSLADAMQCIARMGGHIKNNGPPGWQTLAWGYEQLLSLRLGWELAFAEKSDQS